MLYKCIVLAIFLLNYNKFVEAECTDTDLVFELIENGERLFDNNDLENIDRSTIVLGDVNSNLINILKDGQPVEKAEPKLLNEYLVHEIIPEIVINNQTGSAYHIYRKTNSIQGPSIELASEYFLRKISDYVSSIRILCVIDYNYLDEFNVFDIIGKIVAMIGTNIINDENIGLIITNVPQNADPNLSMEIITTELNGLQRSIMNTMNLDSEMDRKQKSIYVMDKLLKNPDKIRMLRNTENDIHSSDDEKIAVIELIEGLQFIEMTEFGDYLSSNSKNYVNMLNKDIENCIGVELQSINEDLLLHYNGIEKKKATNIHILRNEFSKSFYNLFDMLSDMENINTASQLQHNIANFLSELNFLTSNGNLYKIRKLTQRYNILREFDPELEITGFIYKQYFKSSEKFIKDSKLFYEFLVNLQAQLSDYKVKKRIASNNFYNTEHLFNELNKLPIAEDLSGAILGDLLHDVYSSDTEIGYKEPSRDFYNIKDIKINKYKALRILEILQFELKQTMSIDCTQESTLNVIGIYVILENAILESADCYKKATNIKIQALKKIYIDTNINRTEKYFKISLIAPEIDVINEKNIQLIGKDGDLVKNGTAAEDGTDGDPNGSNGLPGNPGYSGGSVFIMANVIHNGKNLKVSSIGGSGSNGQNGGNGQPLEDDAIKYDDKTWKCTKDGKPVETASGGDGGKGGYAGYSGEITVAELHGTNLVKIEALNGTEGKDGQFGYSGDFMAKFGDEHIKVLGCNGKRGSITSKGIESAKPKIRINKIEHIYDYKKYLLTNLDNKYINEKLLEYYYDISDYELSTTDMLAFFNELIFYEDSYFKERENFDFMPFYKLLAKRIVAFANHNVNNTKNIENVNERKKVLSYLYTATMSKISALSLFGNRNLIADLMGYLGNLEESLDILEKSDYREIVHNANRAYKAEIDQKISEGETLINLHVTPEIENINKKTANRMNELIDETEELINKANKYKKALEKKREELKKSTKIKLLADILSGIGKVASMTGPWGAAIGTGLSLTSSLTETFGVGDLDGPDKRDELRESVKEIVHNTNKFLEEKKQAKIAVLEDQLKILKSDDGIPFFEITSNLINSAERVKDNSSDIYDVMKEYLDEFNKKREELIAQNITSSDHKLNKGLKFLEKLDKAFQVADAANTIYKNYRENEKKLNEFEKAINDAEEEIKQLRKYRDVIEKTYVPMLKNMSQDMTHVIDSLGNKSSINLDVTKWKVQQSIRDIKNQMKKVTKGFDVSDDLQQTITKLEEALNVIIVIFDKIANYREHKVFADYLYHITSPRIQNIILSDPTYQNKLQRLEYIIKSNVVLSSYENLMAGVDQLVFPFANYYLVQFQIPDEFKIKNNITLLIDTIRNHVKTLTHNLKLSNTIMNEKHDSAVTTTSFKLQKKSQPFYTWKYTDNNIDLTKLFNGEQILLTADITQSLKMNAIKFQEIDLYFSSNNPDKQNSLTKLLNHFKLNLTHSGLSYYRCNTKFFIISNEVQVIEFTYLKDKHGPLHKNNVYTKLKMSDFKLSPYASWSLNLIPLKNANWDELKKYSYNTDIHLTGFGQYVAPESDICNDNLEKYYTMLEK